MSSVIDLGQWCISCLVQAHIVAPALGILGGAAGAVGALGALGNLAGGSGAGAPAGAGGWDPGLPQSMGSSAPDLGPEASYQGGTDIFGPGGSTTSTSGGITTVVSPNGAVTASGSSADGSPFTYGPGDLAGGPRLGVDDQGNLNLPPPPPPPLDLPPRVSPGYVELPPPPPPPPVPVGPQPLPVPTEIHAGPTPLNAGPPLVGGSGPVPGPGGTTINQAGGQTVVTSPDGIAVTAVPTGGGGYQAGLSDGNVLTVNPDGSASIQLPDGSTQNWDAHGGYTGTNPPATTYAQQGANANVPNPAHDVVVPMTDGGYRVDHPDGSSDIHWPDGSIVHVEPDQQHWHQVKGPN